MCIAVSQQIVGQLSPSVQPDRLRTWEGEPCEGKQGTSRVRSKVSTAAALASMMSSHFCGAVMVIGTDVFYGQTRLASVPDS